MLRFRFPRCPPFRICFRELAPSELKHAYRLSSEAAGSGSEKAGRCRMRQKQLSEAQQVCFCRMHSGSFPDFRSLPGAKQTNDFLAWCMDGASTPALRSSNIPVPSTHRRQQIYYSANFSASKSKLLPGRKTNSTSCTPHTFSNWKV